MSEPHQRVQSGRLRRPSRQYRASSTQTNTYEIEEQSSGIENAVNLQYCDWDRDFQTYMQTPCTLSNLHISILSKIGKGYGVKGDFVVDKDWRCTWNINSSIVGNKLCISFNIMQPNIAGCWIDIAGADMDVVNDYAQQFRDINLPNSSCRVSGTNVIKVQGRWALHLTQRLLDAKIVAEDKIKIATLNITQSKLFCWIILSTGSEYLCTLTKESVQILTRYLPDWCIDINEVNSAGNTTLRIKNPVNVNDSSQLTISTTGSVQYNGKIENVGKLPEAVSIAINKLTRSPFLRQFLESLEYKKTLRL